MLGRRQIRGSLVGRGKEFGFISRSHWSTGFQPEAIFPPLPGHIVGITGGVATGQGFWKHPKRHTAASTTKNHPAPMSVELRLRNPAYKQEGVFAVKDDEGASVEVGPTKGCEVAGAGRWYELV